MAVYSIKHRSTGAVLYSTEAGSMREAVEAAVQARVDLVGADLAGEDLAGANLKRANLAWANLYMTNLYRADLAGADLAGADLYRANLYRANLAGANLAGADLAGADLKGASYGEGVPLTRPPLSISGLRYPVLILDEHLKVGCQLHHIDEWVKFDDRRIAQMDGSDALRFWRANKESLLALATAHRLSDAA